MKDDNDSVIVKVVDAQVAGLQIQTEIPMTELRELMGNPTYEIKELWFDFVNNDGKVRILFNYSYSKKFMYDMQCGEWRH